MTQISGVPWAPWDNMNEIQAQKARANLEEALRRLHGNTIRGPYVQPSPPVQVKGLQDYDDADLVMEMLGRGFVVMPVKDLEDKL